MRSDLIENKSPRASGEIFGLATTGSGTATGPGAVEFQNDLVAPNRRIDSVNEFVEYVSEEPIEQQRRQAGIGTQTKWWLTEMPEGEEG